MTNVIPMGRRTDPDPTVLEISQQTIPGRTTITLLTVQARHSDGSPDTNETGLLIETDGTAPVSASQARKLAQALQVAADKFDVQDSR